MSHRPSGLTLLLRWLKTSYLNLPNPTPCEAPRGQRDLAKTAAWNAGIPAVLAIAERSFVTLARDPRRIPIGFARAALADLTEEARALLISAETTKEIGMPRLDPMTLVADMPGGPWSLEQVQEAMRRIAISCATNWADSAFAHRHMARDMLREAVDREELLREEAAAQLEQATQAYAVEIDRLFNRIADDIGLTDRVDRQALATECAAVFNARCAELAANMVDTMGRA